MSTSPQSSSLRRRPPFHRGVLPEVCLSGARRGCRCKAMGWDWAKLWQAFFLLWRECGESIEVTWSKKKIRSNSWLWTSARGRYTNNMRQHESERSLLVIFGGPFQQRLQEGFVSSSTWRCIYENLRGFVWSWRNDMVRTSPEPCNRINWWFCIVPYPLAHCGLWPEAQLDDHHCY